MQQASSIHWNAYPALLLAGAFALGIGASVWIPARATGLWTAIALGGLTGAGLLLAWPQHRLVSLRPLAITLLLGAAACALGSLRATIDQHPAADAIERLLPTGAHIDRVTVLGRVRSIVEQRPRGARLTLQTDTLIYRADTVAVRGRVRVFLRVPPWESLAPFPAVRQADRLQLRGTLQSRPQRRNPADFDYGAYLQRRSIDALLQVDAPADVAITARPPVYGAPVVALRRHIHQQLDRLIAPPQARAIVRALLTGDRGLVTEATRTQFAETGLLHLLAISGLHVLLVGMVVYTLLRPMLIRARLRWQTAEWTRAAVTLGLLTGFAILTGGRPSVVRAVVMAALFIGANGMQRHTHSLNTLGVAALVLLVYRPLALFDVGFQLSFAAVGAIVLLNPRFSAALPAAWQHGGWRGHLGALATVSLAATLGTMPVLLVHFGYVSFAGLVLNLVAIPLTALAMTAGLLTTLYGGWFDVVAVPLGAAAEILTQGLVHVAAWGHVRFAWASLTKPVQDPWMLGALISSLLVIAHWPHPRRRWRLIVATVLLAGLGIWSDILTVADSSQLDVVFFDVGQGDAALVALPNGQHLLVDAGPRSPYADAGSAVIVPHLQWYGINRLDAVVISHADSDHLGGLPAVLRHIPVERVILNPVKESTRLTREVHHVLDSLAVPVEPAYAGDTLSIDPGTYIQVLNPPKEVSPRLGDNEASIVMRIVYGKTRLLFTGDIERAAERWVVAQYGDFLPSDVVKVGHHGSSTSSIPALIERAASDSGWAVVSVGRRNRFGLPAPSVLRRWQDAGTKVLTTAQDGAIWMRTDGRQMERVHWRP